MKSYKTINTIKALFALTVVVSVISTFFGVSFLIQSHDNDTFEMASKVKIIIEDEFNKNIFGLQGAKGFVLAKKFEFSQNDFRDYAQSREFFTNFPAALGFGFIRSIKNGTELNIYRKKNESYFLVYPTTHNQMNMVVEVIEPLEANKKALGLDVSFELNRKNAAMQAALSGNAILSDPINLMKSDANEIGFMFFLPVYKTSLTPATEAERLSHLMGWTFARVALDESINKILSKISFQSEVEVSIEGLDHVLKFGKIDWLSRHSIFKISNSVTVGGKIWKLTLKPNSFNFFAKMFLILTLLALTLFLELWIYKKIVSEIRKSSLQSNNIKINWADSIIENSALAIIATNEHGIISLFNPAAESLLGYKKDELVDLKTPEVFHDKNEIIQRAQLLSKKNNRLIQPGFDVFVANVKSGASEALDWTYISKTGERVPVRLTVNRINNEIGECIGYLGIVVDLRESKIMQEVIEQQKLMMFASAKMIALGELTSGIAHEINTPLAIIIGQCELMIDKMNSNKANQFDLQADIKRIKDTAGHVARVVKSMRQVSRNSTEDQLTKVSLRETLQNAIDLCAEKLKNSHIKLDIIIEIEHMINCRSSDISQVFLNLISNSIDALKNEKNGWINIEVKENGDKLIIDFIDSGLGIEPLIAEKMMNPFFTTKPVGQGTGLGLSISKAIIESHGGELKYLEASQNTCFQIELPLELT